jgi:peroxiredoxin Q/BCP
MLYPLSYGGIMGPKFTPVILSIDPIPVHKILILLLVLAVLGLFLAFRAGRGELPAQGVAAPAFDLADAAGHRHRLADYGGRWLVLYFYPKDETPGCTAEACALRDDFAAFRQRGVALLGVSLDDAASHAAFAQRHGLPFPLLSDPDGVVARAYGSLWNLGPIRMAKRHTFVIDPRGRIARVFRDVSPKGHARELLAALDQLKLEAGARDANN